MTLKLIFNTYKLLYDYCQLHENNKVPISILLVFQKLPRMVCVWDQKLTLIGHLLLNLKFANIVN